MKPWDGIISEEDQKATYAAGFGRPSSIGKRPALLIIDVQYRTIGTSPKPMLEAIREFPTSCGDVGWNAMRNIALLLAEFAPREGDVLIPKKHPSAFFATPLASHLIDLGADTLVVTGCTTSGCVRGSVVDAFAYNFRAFVPHDAVYDRCATSHAVNLFDMAAKYADVATTAEILERLRPLAKASPAVRK